MRLAAVLAGGPLAALLAAGCTGSQTPTATTTTSRSQASDDFSEKLAKAAIADKTVVANVEPIPVSGVGLVWKLPRGSGGNARAPWREMLEKSLRQKKLNPKEFLDDPDKTCSLVLVSGTIAAGAKKNDPVDIFVTLPDGSDTTSLKGGVLFECDLYPTARAGDLRDEMIRAGRDVGKTPIAGGETTLAGQPLVRAAGQLVAGDTSDKSAEVAGGYRAGVVWGGGRFLETRPYWFVLTDEKNKSARMAGTIAARLNEAFPALGGDRTKTANAISKDVVFVQVPPAYRLNHARFLIAARKVTMAAMPANDPRRGDLERQLLEPETCIPAALALEACGADVQAALRVGLESQSPWVRFAAAESLAYLGSTAGAAELAKLAETNPGLRSHCLTALATLDDGVSTDRLTEMMAHPDPQLRYGAFAAMRAGNPAHPSLGGKQVQKAFWLHHVAPSSAALVHMTSGRRSEVVVFGTPGEVAGPFSFPLGSDFVVTRKDGEPTVSIAKVVPGKDGLDTLKATCKPTIGSVLSALGEMGGGYSEAVEFVRRANAAKVLAAAVAVDAAPRGIPVTQLAVLSRNDPQLETANLEVARASRSDAAPTTFDLPTDADAVKTAAAVEANDLARNPGRLFAPKKHPGEADDDLPVPPKPADPPAPDGLARNPGKLFK